MAPEIEAKILDIDVDAVIVRLRALGATVKFDGELDAIYYDHHDLGVRERKETLRVRKEGDKTVLAFKRKADKSSGMKEAEELEVEVADAQTLHAILGALGCIQYHRLRKHRIEFTLGDAHVAIDTYKGEVSFVPPFAEIEAPTKDEVLRVAALLGFPPESCLPWGGKDVEKHYRKEPGR